MNRRATGHGPHWVPAPATPPLALRRIESADWAEHFHERLTVIETDQIRAILHRGQRLTLLPKHPRRPVRGAQRQTVTVLRFTEPVIGQRLEYIALIDGSEARRTLGIVESIAQYTGDLAGPAIIDDDSTGVAVERHRVQTLWGLDTLGPEVTVRIHTSGQPPFDGTWIFQANGHAFLPDNPNQPVRTWSALWLESYARTHATLWVGEELAPGVWTPIAETGVGSIDWITVETLQQARA